MESQPQNPEFRNNPEIFHPCLKKMQQFFCFFFLRVWDGEGL